MTIAKQGHRRGFFSNDVWLYRFSLKLELQQKSSAGTQHTDKLYPEDAIANVVVKEVSYLRCFWLRYRGGLALSLEHGDRSPVSASDKQNYPRQDG